MTMTTTTTMTGDAPVRESVYIDECESLSKEEPPSLLLQLPASDATPTPLTESHGATPTLLSDTPTLVGSDPVSQISTPGDVCLNDVHRPPFQFDFDLEDDIAESPSLRLLLLLSLLRTS